MWTHAIHQLHFTLTLSLGKCGTTAWKWLYSSLLNTSLLKMPQFSSRTSVPTDVWAKFVPGGAVQGSPCPLQTHLSWAGWSAPYFFSQSHIISNLPVCGATSKFLKYLWKPINCYNDTNNIFVNANLLLCFPQAQPGKTVKAWQLWVQKHGNIYWEAMASPSLPFRVHPHPLQPSRGLSPSEMVGAGQSQGGGCQLGLGFAAGAVLLPAPWQAAPRPTEQGKAHPRASYLWHKYHRQLHFRFLRLHQWSCLILLQWIPIIQVISLN